MNHKIKRLWCAAMRGGMWEEIEGDYTDGDKGRCAFGVLMEVLKPTMGENETVLLTWIDDHTSFYEARSIVEMNDSGKSFSEIADWIEENL